MRTDGRVMVAALVGALALTAGCATKKQLRTAIDRERSERVAGDSANAAQTASQIAAVRAEVAALRGDLTNLRTEFGARITAMEDGVRFALPVHFAFDDATVRTEDQAALDRFASVVQKYYGGAPVTVEGFADPAGTERYNLALSQRRADVVRDYLVQRGLTSALVRSIGYGKTRLVVADASHDDPGAELNRRVVFVVEAPGQSEAGRLTASALTP